jgi:hypothetical protein
MNGTPSTRPIKGDELRALRRLQRESPTSAFVFVSERDRPSRRPAARVIERAAAGAGLELKAHPHMLSACLRLRLRQQGARHPAAQVDHQYGRLHGVGAEPVPRPSGVTHTAATAPLARHF